MGSVRRWIGNTQEEPPQQFSVVWSHVAELEGNPHLGKATFGNRDHPASFVTDGNGNSAHRTQGKVLRASDEKAGGAQIDQFSRETDTTPLKPDEDLEGCSKSL